MVNYFKVDILSLNQKIFSGKVQKIFVTGITGEIEILHKHAPLITLLEPGPIWLMHKNGKEEAFIILGSFGFLDIQKKNTVILADYIVRSVDINEQKLQQAKNFEYVTQKTYGEQDHIITVNKQLALAMTQFQIIRKLYK